MEKEKLKSIRSANRWLGASMACGVIVLLTLIVFGVFVLDKWDDDVKQYCITNYNTEKYALIPLKSSCIIKNVDTLDNGDIAQGEIRILIGDLHGNRP